jgi:hypothetical protein
LVLLAASCGGRVEEGADLTPAPIFTAHIGAVRSTPGLPDALLSQCLPASLPSLGESPDCTIVRASFPHGAVAPAADVAACQACAATGLRPMRDAARLSHVSPALASYACVCEITPRAPGLACTPEVCDLSWCYEPAPAGRCDGAAITFAGNPVDEADLYIACFAERPAR